MSLSCDSRRMICRVAAVISMLEVSANARDGAGKTAARPAGEAPDARYTGSAPVARWRTGIDVGIPEFTDATGRAPSCDDNGHYRRSGGNMSAVV